MSITAMKQALEALEMFYECDAFIPNLKKLSKDDEDFEESRREGVYNAVERVITALRQAIEQAEQAEPVVCPYCHNSHTLGAVYFDQNCVGCVKRMTSPPQRKWVGLTDEEVLRLVPGLQDCLCDPYDYNNSGDDYASIPKDMIRLARAIEAKLKEKNNA